MTLSVLENLSFKNQLLQETLRNVLKTEVVSGRICLNSSQFTSLFCAVSEGLGENKTLINKCSESIAETVASLAAATAAALQCPFLSALKDRMRNVQRSGLQERLSKSSCNAAWESEFTHGRPHMSKHSELRPRQLSVERP